MIGTVSYSVKADPEDKRELSRMISQEKDIKLGHFRMDAVDNVEIIYIISGILKCFKIIYEFLKKKKDKDVDIIIRKRDGTTISVNSKNADELKVYIDELEASE